MINKHKKGQRKELLCQKDLEKEGYKVVFRSRTIKQGPIYVGIDFADLFDVIGLSTNKPMWRFISVKPRGSFGKHESDISEFIIHYGLDNASFELWKYHKPRWVGRGKNKTWVQAHWEKKVI